MAVPYAERKLRTKTSTHPCEGKKTNPGREVFVTWQSRMLNGS